jgi:DNA repair exonuclease SbcCD ATPase subunit
MSFKCAHISDIHWRGLTRHDEYRESFEGFFRKLRELEPNIIFVGGDIVHSKTQGISPELIDCLCWWFEGLAAIAPTHIILGNHDGLILNKHRQDAITPIIKALDNDNLYLYKESGTYPTGVDGFNWCVFSCFDEPGWEKVKPIPGDVNIALFHGGVWGSLTDIDWEIEGEVDVEFFKDYEFAFLGDIHKLQYLDESQKIAYPGSSIQQNYGEDTGKGFLFWEIEDLDNYKSTFYEIPHSKPFVTIPWRGSVKETLSIAKKKPKGARFRIRTDQAIPQAEIKHLHSSLKELCNAAEIVFKHDIQVESNVIKTDSGEFFKEDLRDARVHQHLMRVFYSDVDLSSDQWDRLDELIVKYVHAASKSDVPRNIKWSLKSLEFDNTFAYGKGNVINFDTLGGITGIFGKNRSGKSSIPGTIMFALFNTTDRGPISNLHIINSRKGHCFARVDISANGKLYRVERQAIRHESRSGKVRATTHLNLLEVDAEGNVVNDLNGEQRRETEKTLRSIVGTADDFLMTALASQGEMNNFIKHRATQRKSILTKFLDLNIFDEMLTLAKDDSSEVKALLKGVPDRDWDIVIKEKQMSYKENVKLRDDLEAKIADLRAQLHELNISLATHKSKDLVTRADVDEQERVLVETQRELEDTQNKIDILEGEISDVLEKIKSISTIKSQFPIEELKERYGAQKDLERLLVNLEHSHSTEKTLLRSQKKSIKKLEEVPCGDKFPTCKFIKDSHKNKSGLAEQEEKTTNILSQVRAARKSLTVLKKEGLEEKIKKYDEILQKEAKIKVGLSNKRLRLNTLINSQSSLKTSTEESERSLRDMRLRVSDSDIAEEVSKMKSEINMFSQKINNLDSRRLSLSETVGHLNSEIKSLRDEKEKYRDLVERWYTYDLFINAVSKKGIPLQIMSSQLPIINKEVSRILQGVVGFTVELEASETSNDMDIYINYGDSKRIIECGSGMEKMMSSLAIRVALINVSALPKTDLLVIDEGFGALDEMNIESCNRLLDSLRKWFRSILVISHVDAVKDAVDNILDITQKEKDAMVVHE